jgi:hypothetical protein
MITLLIGIAALLGGIALGLGLFVLRKPPPVSQLGDVRALRAQGQ